MKALLLCIWEGWKRIAHWIGGKLGTLIYTALYFSLMGLVALIRWPFSDPFQYRNRRNTTFWVPRGKASEALEEAMRQ